MFVVRAGDLGYGVGLFEVAAELRVDIVPGQADGNGASQLRFHSLADFPRHPHRVAAADKADRAGDVEPTLVGAERLNEIGVMVIYISRILGITPVQPAIGRGDYEAGAFCLLFPDGFGGLDFVGLRFLAFGEDYSMSQPCFPATATGLFLSSGCSASSTEA